MRRALAMCLVVVACGDDDPVVSDTGDTSGMGDTDVTGETDVTGDDVAPDTSEVTPAAPWYEGAVMYEVFVRSFQDSDGDGIGDLTGLVNRLDYLNDGVPGTGDDLEVDGLWLMPIFQSPSYHGYDVTDYEAIEPDYGTLADFDALIAACEQRGIKVVLDFVMNHTGSGHPWFTAAKTPSDPKHAWYVWRDDNPGWKQPFGSGDVWHPLGARFYYGVFWSEMPDLNYREPGVVTAMTDIAKGWLARGAAGFRLDAARYLVESEDGGLFEQPETHTFWQSFRAELEAEHDAYLVGEVWTSRAAVATYWGEGAELHQTFDFDLQGAILQAAERHEATWLRTAISAQRTSAVPWSFSATFLSNHDLDRVSQNIDDGEQRSAALVLMTLPGTPYLYYGDELGMRSSPAIGDPAKRGPMAWTAATGHGFSTGTPWLEHGPEADVRNVATALADPNSLARLYQALIRVRKAHPTLAGPGVVAVVHPDPALFVMLRHGADGLYLVAISLSDQAIASTTLDLTTQATVLAPLGEGPWDMTIVFGQDAGGDVTDPSAVPIGAFAPHEGRIWKLTPGGPGPRPGTD